jgi:hypothetical protein
MSSATRHFIRHYVEMLAAMFLGMGVIGMPGMMVLDAPGLQLLVMGVSMTVPMVAWMRFRGHGWPATLDMTLAMLLPTAGVLALLGAGVADFDALMAIEHVVMLPAMLVAMLLRRDEYTGADHQHGRQEIAA